MKSLLASSLALSAWLLPTEASAQSDEVILSDEQFCEQIRISAARLTGTVVGPATVRASVDCGGRIMEFTYQITEVPNKDAYAQAVFDAGYDILCAPDTPSPLIRSYGYRMRYILDFSDGTSMDRTINCD